ncbi:(S)-1-Phenylethanol dehydrogenase [Streptomyces sp. YIM 130001]|uniref:SDR family NAD(P)-dependent oxidoreductase n=1 Tax=Streptomyces sp. YIM 130001 TaxID=2259644 RepID=UPI000E64F93D|nr:SDR family NAD(P)-dependent oxidoreductase [Streptomyces sp. YIM 130001]RII12315.1 (S)-1-Phenylethanol dehydrogenase [Streptomyces sp. YIM 130001]
MSRVAHKQHPVGSGFTAASTADEVVAGIDLTGKYAVITGGHAGIGLEVTRALAGAGASVTVGSRDPGRATAALAEAGIHGVEVGRLDLLEPASINAFTESRLQTRRPLHILVNCAGVPPPKQLERDARGYETQFATNHLGHFQLTLALHPALRSAAESRVVNVSSGAHRFADIRWDDPNFQRDEYHPGAAYAQSKVANVLFAVGLDNRWSEDGIRGYAVHPGVIVGTALNSSAGREALLAEGLIDESGRPVIDPERGKKTPRQGAATIVFAATSPLLDEIGGVYLKDNDIAPLDDEPRPVTADEAPSDAASHSIDPQSAARLWKLSEDLLES